MMYSKTDFLISTFQAKVDSRRKSAFARSEKRRRSFVLFSFCLLCFCHSIVFFVLSVCMSVLGISILPLYLVFQLIFLFNIIRLCQQSIVLVFLSFSSIFDLFSCFYLFASVSFSFRICFAFTFSLGDLPTYLTN